MTMIHRASRFVLAFLVVFSFVRSAPADGPQIADPAKVDADYAIQGEYSGQISTPDGPRALGVQVIALGGGRFHASACFGGLPGDGWDGGERESADGVRADGVVTFRGPRGKGVVRGGAMEITDDAGQVLGKLQRVVRKSPTLGKKPPKGAIVLFDGTSADPWVSTRGGPARMSNGLLHQGANSRRKFQSHNVHIEFRLPYEPYDRGQGRANSGIYLQGRYEVQMLDSFGLEGKDNECGGIYEIRAPSVNMCLPPLQWQTYDIQFTQARYDQHGKKTANARLTVRHNGVLIHRDVEVPRSTRAAPNKEGPEPGFIHLQDHGSPVRYRNIWVVETQ